MNIETNDPRIPRLTPVDLLAVEILHWKNLYFKMGGHDEQLASADCPGCKRITERLGK